MPHPIALISSARAARRPRFGLALALALAPSWAFAQAPSAPGTAACAAWPGELAPLPSTESADSLSASWAELRARELDRVARAVAATNPASAHRLWRHALCLDPKAEDVRTRLAALAPVRASMASPIVVRQRPSLTPGTPKNAYAALDAGLQTVADALSQARFREALEGASAARRLLDEQSALPEVLERRARLEVMVSTAQVALGNENEAAASLRRALEAAPELRLDPSTPPKVRRLLSGIRSETAVGAP